VSVPAPAAHCRCLPAPATRTCGPALRAWQPPTPPPRPPARDALPYRLTAAAPPDCRYLGAVTASIQSNEGFAPLTAQADCPSDAVPGGGSMTCKFTAPLPVGGAASNPANWENVYVTLNLATGGSCQGSGSVSQQGVNPTPSACPDGISTGVSGWTSTTGDFHGTLTIQNSNSAAVAIDDVHVQINNNVPVAPLFPTASCTRTTVPAGGSVTCSFNAHLPDLSSIKAGSKWTQVMSTVQFTDDSSCGASLSLGGAQPGPIVYGRK